MFGGQPGNAFHLRQSDVLAKRIAFVAALQGQDHRFSHARVSHTWRKAKIKAKIHWPWHIDHSAINDQYVVSFLHYAA